MDGDKRENMEKNKKDKASANRIMRKIKDLNNLVQKMKNTNPYEKLKLEKFFSLDKLDKIYLDFELYPKNTNFKPPKK